MDFVAIGSNRYDGAMGTLPWRMGGGLSDLVFFGIILRDGAC